MGVTYKLRPEVRDYIIEQKKANPALSCRSLTALVGQKFQFHISKSSINTIFKETGLSMPVGRRSKTKKLKPKPFALIEQPVPKLLTVQIPPAPQLQQKEETPPPEVFQGLVPKISLKKPAEISALQNPTPDVVGFQPMKEPEPVQAVPQQELPEPVKETPPAEIAVPAAAPVEETQQRTEEKKIEPPTEAAPKEKPEPAQPLPAQKPCEETEPETKPAGTPEEIPCTGALLFKAVDYLFGGVQGVVDRIKVRLDKPEASLEERVAAAIYSNTFSLPEELFFLAGKQVPQEELSRYITGLQENKQGAWDLVRALLNALDEVRSIKVSISDGSSLFIDGQFHSAWNTNQVPYDFNNPLCNTKHYVNKYFYENSPLIFLMATGTETPSKEFFNLLLALDANTKSLTKLTLCGNDDEELQINSFESPKKKQYLFGLWPGQFIQQRKVKKIDEFKPVFVPSINKELYVAACEIQLQEPNLNQSILLGGCAVKYTASEKIRLLVVGNICGEALSGQKILDAYFNRWPQPDYAYQDFSRKVEIFTYTAGSRYIAPSLILNVDKNQPTIEVRTLFDNYVKALDFYIRRALLPAGYHDKTFSFMREQFYSLPVKIKVHKSYSMAIFYPPPEYRLRTDLVYLCRKLNEREITTPATKRLWFSL